MSWRACAHWWRHRRHEGRAGGSPWRKRADPSDSRAAADAEKPSAAPAVSGTLVHRSHSFSASGRDSDAAERLESAARHGGDAGRAHCGGTASVPASCVSAVRSSRSRWAGLETAALDRDHGDSCCILWNRLCLHDTPFSLSAYFAAAVRRCTAGTVPFYTRPENLHDREPPRAADVRHFPSDGAAAGRSAGRSGTVSACPGARIGAYPPQRLSA